MKTYHHLNANRPLPFDRDTFGQHVREAWVRWAEKQPSPKPSWLVPYEQLSEPDKEADRQIGEHTLIGDAASRSEMTSRGELPTTEQENLRLKECLLMMAEQYLKSPQKTPDGRSMYDHSFMSAGEETLEALEDLGVIQSDQCLLP